MTQHLGPVCGNRISMNTMTVFVGNCPKCGGTPRMIADAGRFHWVCNCPPERAYTSDNTSGRAIEQSIAGADMRGLNTEELSKVLFDEAYNLRGENERLRSDAARHEKNADLQMERAIMAEAEIRRLRAALKPFAEADFENWMATADCTVPDEAWRAARATNEQPPRCDVCGDDPVECAKVPGQHCGDR